jgi:hypothetical protein
MSLLMFLTLLVLILIQLLDHEKNSYQPALRAAVICTSYPTEWKTFRDLPL